MRFRFRGKTYFSLLNQGLQPAADGMALQHGLPAMLLLGVIRRLGERF
jgi:hypothetical protein